MNWIFLSPHLDDAVLSCGGLIAAQTDAGIPVEIWTICAGDPPPGLLSNFAQFQHWQWNLGPDAAEARREEDQLAGQRLGARVRHFPVPDAIYRRSGADGESLYASEEAIFGPLAPEEHELIASVSRLVAGQLGQGAHLVCPLGVGGHVDHRLTRSAAEALGLGLRYYADFPYAQAPEASAEGGEMWEETLGMAVEVLAISQPQFQRWEDAILAYPSQVPVLWGNELKMRQDLQCFHDFFNGVPLWSAAN